VPYLNLDDNFADHEKVDALTDGAFRLHVAGMCYSARKLSDGHIPESRPRRLTRTFKASLVPELLNSGLWLPSDKGGYEIHDYLDWNKSAEWWRDYRAKEAKRIAEWRESRKGEHS